jgi:hypothetical protein
METKKTIEIHEETSVYGIYDDTNYQVTVVFADGKEILNYDPKYYPPFSYGGEIRIDNSKSYDSIYFEKEDREEDGLLITIYPPHGAKLVRVREKDKNFFFDD